ncbi:MAG TPA: DUF5908 family protein [Puia sp.]|jgi:hypothetical protein|nr:DUF5908 family protein [Puia sp.]
MPIEIRELLIKVTVEENIRPVSADPAALQDLKNRIVKECLDKILLKLTNSPER